MNTQLIPVFAGQIQGQSVQLVDARLLHSFLEVATQFKDWIARRIEEYGFLEDQDFCSILSKTKGRPQKNYHVTIDMAKELAMVERNEKGRIARRYFIDCERQLKESQLVSNTDKLPNSEPSLSLSGRILMTIRNGQIISSEPLDKDAMIFNPRSAPSIRSWVFDYLPYQHLHIALEAINERSMAIARGMNPQSAVKA